MRRKITGSKVPDYSTMVPAARTKNLLVHASQDGALIYDQERHHIHQPNEVAMAVWRACDGWRTLNDIALEATASTGAAVNATIVQLTLTKLEEANLLSEPLPEELKIERVGRRRFMKRAAEAGIVAFPVIVSISAPQAAAANSTQCVAVGHTCGGGLICCPGGVCLSDGNRVPTYTCVPDR